MAKTFPKLQHYWREWCLGLETIADKRGCRVALPSLTTHASDAFGPGTMRVALAHPICLLNAPPKGSSHVAASSEKCLTIFIDGELFVPSELPSRLLHSSCSVSFYRHETTDDTTAFRARLVDTSHFDMEKADSPSPFHPVLHAQRGFRDDNLGLCRQAVVVADRGIDVEKVVLDCGDAGHIARNPYLRLPTPQLDIFSVSAIIAADYFCSGGHSSSDPGVKTRFQDLLGLLAGEKNLAREGGMAKRLFEKFNAAGHACVAHWYEEHGVAEMATAA